MSFDFSVFVEIFNNLNHIGLIFVGVYSFIVSILFIHAAFCKGWMCGILSYLPSLLWLWMLEYLPFAFVKNIKKVMTIKIIVITNFMNIIVVYYLGVLLDFILK
jgi:hypothetical protein